MNAGGLEKFNFISTTRAYFPCHSKVDDTLNAYYDFFFKIQEVFNKFKKLSITVQ